MLWNQKEGRMKKLAVLVGLGWCLMIGRAEASVFDWPVVSHLSNVVRCVVVDAGTIGKSFVTHASGFAVETLTTVGKCLLYIGEQVVPGIVTEPPSH